MSRQRDTFREAFGTWAGGVLGFGAGLVILKGGMNLLNALAASYQWRADNPSEFDAWVVDEMRVRGWDTPAAQSFWLFLGLLPLEKARIEQKLLVARNPIKIIRHTKPTPSFNEVMDLARQLQRPGVRGATRRRTALRARNLGISPERLRGHEPLQLNAAPAAQLPALEEPVLKSKSVKQTKRHGTKGRIARDTKSRLVFYADLRVNKGISHQIALIRTARHFASNEREGAMKRSVQDAVRRLLDNGRDLGKLRRFLENASKRA